MCLKAAILQVSRQFRGIMRNIIYVCQARGFDFASCVYGFSIGFINCSDHSVVYCCSCYHCYSARLVFLPDPNPRTNTSYIQRPDMYILYIMHLLFLLHLYNEKEDFRDRVVGIVDF